jgi:hypothetical protein
MRTIYLIFTFILFASAWKLHSQISTSKTTIKFNNAPELNIENIQFIDENKDQKAETGEKCFLTFKITNTGKSKATGVRVFTESTDSIHNYFSLENSFPVGEIKTGETKEVKMPMVLLASLELSKVNFKLIAEEANDYTSKPVSYSIMIKNSGVSKEFNWTYPDMTEIRVNNNTATIKVCIASNNPVTELAIYKNGSAYPIDRGFKLKKTEGCEHYLEQGIELDEGNNYIQIKAKINKSKAESEIRNIIFRKVEYEKRYALVIGNSDYITAPLRNPVNDALLITSELKKVGFNVRTVRNGSQNEMKQAISEFGELLSKDKKSVGLFYYAGHGIQIKGKNYLVPTDAKIEREPDVEVFCVDLDGLLANLEYAGNNMNIIILDACRNNPYGRGFRSTAGNGLATVNAPVGTFIAYATSPGSVAADGSGNNGLYTQEFAKAIAIPYMKIEDVFKKVRSQVKTISGGQQIPWENSSIEGDFYFIK